jgi:phosphoglucosamine mutase
MKAKRKLFGTDGIRGRANEDPITAELALAVAMAAGSHHHGGGHGLAVIGKDTRLSGYLLEPALTAGFIAVGMDVVLLGPLPTPAVGMLTRSLRADLGVVISASHNPFDDNGIKFFGPDGFKLSDEVEAAIEARIAGGTGGLRVASERLGRARRLDDARGRYIEFVKQSLPRRQRLEGLKVVLDCANGAAYAVAPAVLYELGAEVIAMGVSPDGININRDCGATAPKALSERVVAEGADIGIALDGDADRVILVDEKGRVIDGDQVMGLIAKRWLEEGRLKGGGVVATVMSNLGLQRFLEDFGIGLERTPVGDRYVVERMRGGGFNLGGEQSGHIVMTDYSTTGDGLIAALQVLSALIDEGRPASEVVHVFERVPQVLKNVKVTDRAVIETPALQAAIRDGEAELGKGGRLVIRPSGTEPLIRVMAEGDDSALVNKVVDALIERIGAGA